MTGQRTTRGIGLCIAMILVGIMGGLAQTMPASASTCGARLVSGAAYMYGHGATVKSNGADQGSGNSCAGSVTNGLGWQCVELASRLWYTLHWTYGEGTYLFPSSARVAYAYQIYDKVYAGTNHSAYGYKAYAPGSGYIPVLGDLIILSKQSGVPYGHVSVVDSVGSSVHAVEQNWSPTGKVDYSGWRSTSVTRIGSSATYSLRGFVHALNNTWALPRGSWTPIGKATVGSQSTVGSFRIGLSMAGDGGLWSGAKATTKGHVPSTSDYQFWATARLIKNGDGTGPGFGLAVRSTFDPNGVPSARAFQYDRGAGGYRNVAYPSDQGSLRASATDNAWHTVGVVVKGTSYSMYFDSYVSPVFTGTIDADLTSGSMFIRVWTYGGYAPDTTVELSNVAVIPA